MSTADFKSADGPGMGFTATSEESSVRAGRHDNPLKTLDPDKPFYGNPSRFL